jgi:hypothetical protein
MSKSATKIVHPCPNNNWPCPRNVTKFQSPLQRLAMSKNVTKFWLSQQAIATFQEYDTIAKDTFSRLKQVEKWGFSSSDYNEMNCNLVFRVFYNVF